MPIPVALLSFIASPKKLMYAGLAIGVVILGFKVMSFIDAKNAAEAQVDHLTTQVSALEERIETANFLREQAALATNVAEAARDQAEKDAAHFRSVRNNVIRAGGNDETVPNSLRITLDALRVRDAADEDTD